MKLRDKRARFTALLHHVSVELLRYSALQLKRGAAPEAAGVVENLLRLSGGGPSRHAARDTLPGLGVICRQSHESVSGTGSPYLPSMMGGDVAISDLGFIELRGLGVNT